MHFAYIFLTFDVYTRQKITLFFASYFYLQQKIEDTCKTTARSEKKAGLNSAMQELVIFSTVSTERFRQACYQMNEAVA